LTSNSQLLIGTGFINCKMPIQSRNLSGRNNTTGLDIFQPPLSLDGGPDVLLDYFLLYAAFSFALQRPDAFIWSQISQSFTMNSTAESINNVEAKIKFIINNFNFRKYPLQRMHAAFQLLDEKEKSSRVCQDFSGICCCTFECSHSRTFLICHPHVCTTTS